MGSGHEVGHSSRAPALVERRRDRINAAIIDALPSSVALLDGDGVIRAVNAGWVRFGLERSNDGVLADAGTSYLDITDRAADAGDVAAKEAADAIRAVLAGQVDHAVVEYPSPETPSPGWFAMRVTCVRVDDDRWAVVTHDDVTELLEARHRWHSAFTRAAVATAIVDGRNRIVEANQALARLLECEPAALEDRDVLDLVDPADHAVLARRRARMLDTDTDSEPTELRLRRTDGGTVAVTMHPSLIAVGREPRAVVQLVDITGRRRAERRLALHRELLELVAGGTPLPEVALAVAGNLGRAVDGASGVVLLDGQPPVASPDLPLRWLPFVGALDGGALPFDAAVRWPFACAWSVTVPRPAGEPPGAVVAVTASPCGPSAEDEDALEQLASVLRLALQRDETSETLATASPYDALSGPPSVELLGERPRQSRRRHFSAAEDEAADDLRRGLAAGEVAVHYQPIVDLRTGRTRSLEALVRWYHPRRGLVPPPEVIQVAEQCGLINDVGALVLATACRDLARWRRAGATDLSVSVNLSARQLSDPDLIATVRRSLDEGGIEASALVVEITESVVVDDVEQAVAALAALRSLGVRVAIDDFGTGYSSLLYLKRFPADLLKVDRSFVQGLGVHDGDTAIVDAVVGLAHRLGLEVVAEGVETGEQLAALRRRRCDHAQGYLLQRPVPADELDGFLDADAVALGPEPAPWLDGDHDPSTVIDALERSMRDLDDLLRSLDGSSRATTMPSASPIGLGGFVEQTVADLTPLLAHHDVRLDLADSIPPIKVAPAALRQILTNLLGNAVKFTDPGTTIDVVVRSWASGAEIAVVDHGPGIPEGRETELFGRFSRLGATTRGVGIGLHLSLALARGHGGDLVHEGTPGGGATFTLRLMA